MLSIRLESTSRSSRPRLKQRVQNERDVERALDPRDVPAVLCIGVRLPRCTSRLRMDTEVRNAGTSLLERMALGDYEQTVFCSDRSTGLRSIIAIHDTTLGPALGGVRMYAYASEEQALADCLRLARGMTYKAAAAGLHLGGGKSVIIGDP